MVLSQSPDPSTLVGSWTFQRSLTDHLSSHVSHVTGVGTISESPTGGLTWTEAGTWSDRGRQSAVSRIHHLEQSAEGWEVQFADRRPFHPWRVGQEVRHQCGSDLYTGLYVIADGTVAWTVTWRCKGPTKDYESRTVWTAAAPPRAQAT